MWKLFELFPRRLRKAIVKVINWAQLSGLSYGSDRRHSVSSGRAGKIFTWVFKRTKIIVTDWVCDYKKKSWYNNFLFCKQPGRDTARCDTIPGENILCCSCNECENFDRNCWSAIHKTNAQKLQMQDHRRTLAKKFKTSWDLSPKFKQKLALLQID